MAAARFRRSEIAPDRTDEAPAGAAPIAGFGQQLIAFLGLFADCLMRQEGCGLLWVSVQGLLSGLQRKTSEAIALQFGRVPRTLQRFLESIEWDEERINVERIKSCIPKPRE